MDWLQALILGIVQGLAEYLPISSSGHLEICRDILGIDLSGEQSLQFDVVLHVATVLSTIVVLWREFVPLCTSFFTFRRDDNFYYVLKLLVSAIPVAIVGLCFKDVVESFFGGNLTVVGICLCITAALLTFAYVSPYIIICVASSNLAASKVIMSSSGTLTSTMTRLPCRPASNLDSSSTESELIRPRMPMT